MLVTLNCWLMYLFVLYRSCQSFQQWQNDKSGTDWLQNNFWVYEDQFLCHGSLATMWLILDYFSFLEIGKLIINCRVSFIGFFTAISIHCKWLVIIDRLNVSRVSPKTFTSKWQDCIKQNMCWSIWVIWEWQLFDHKVEVRFDLTLAIFNRPGGSGTIWFLLPLATIQFCKQLILDEFKVIINRLLIYPPIR